jgi:hypothetical protein
LVKNSSPKTSATTVTDSQRNRRVRRYSTQAPTATKNEICTGVWLRLAVHHIIAGTVVAVVR